MSAPHSTDLVAWHHLRVEVPDTWEVAAYSVEDRVGRLEFNDRGGLLATVSWEPCDREPDRESTMRIFLQNNVLGKDAERRVVPDDLETAVIGPFLLGWDRKGTGPCQALAWAVASPRPPQRGGSLRGWSGAGTAPDSTARQKDATASENTDLARQRATENEKRETTTGHLLRWIFEPRVRSGGLRWDAALAPILSTFDFNDGDWKEYRLHRLHCRLPADYEIEDVIVLPANVKFVFEHPTHHRRLTFRRWGMAEMILRGLSVGAFHAHILKTDGAAIRSQTPCDVYGMEGCLSEYDAPREHHADRFMARRWKNGRGYVWYDRDAMRLYAFEQIGPDKSPALDLHDVIPPPP